MRDFWTILNKICDELPADKAESLRESSGFWAPEICWRNLTQFVNRAVLPNSKDNKSVKIYSILCDKTEDEMKREFESHGC